MDPNLYRTFFPSSTVHSNQSRKQMMYALMTVAAIGHGLMLDPVSRNALQGINTLGGSMWFSQVSRLISFSSLHPLFVLC